MTGRTADRLLRRCALLAGVAAMLACAPSLNWREVHLGELFTLLPCKPDSASRTIALGGKTVSMDMLGCEADGALFAVSRVQAENPAQAPELMAYLRAASMAAVGASAVQPMPNSGDANSSFDVQVKGRRPNGSDVQARMRWLTHGNAVYQIAVYADRLSPAQVEPMVNELHIR